MSANVEVDVRVLPEHLRRVADLLAAGALNGLRAIDLRPPAAGPELELTFAPAPRKGPPSEELIVGVLKARGITVLASRTRRATDWRRR